MTKDIPPSPKVWIAIQQFKGFSGQLRVSVTSQILNAIDVIQGNTGLEEWYVSKLKYYQFKPQKSECSKTTLKEMIDYNR